MRRISARFVDVPLPNACADVVISNGSINLSPRKTCVFKEAFRILKPGGRLLVADMVREPLCHDKQGDTPASKSPAEAWASCVAGTVSPECFLDFLMKAGFVEAKFVGTTVYRTSPETIGALFRGGASRVNRDLRRQEATHGSSQQARERRPADLVNGCFDSPNFGPNRPSSAEDVQKPLGHVFRHSWARSEKRGLFR